MVFALICGSAARCHRAIEVEVPGDQVLNAGSRAPVGHVRQRYADGLHDLSAGQMCRPANAGGAELHLVLIGLQVGDQLLQIVRRQAVPSNQHEWQIDGASAIGMKSVAGS